MDVSVPERDDIATQITQKVSENLTTTFATHEAKEAELLLEHKIDDDRRFAAFDKRLGMRFKWLKTLTVSNIVIVLGFLASAFMFFLSYNDRVVRVETAVVSVRDVIESLHDDLISERALDRQQAADDRNLASAARGVDRIKSLENSAADRKKASEDRAIDRKKSSDDRASDRMKDQTSSASDRMKDKDARAAPKAMPSIGSRESPFPKGSPFPR